MSEDGWSDGGNDDFFGEVGYACLFLHYLPLDEF
jgi:hypothetical protein